MATSKDDQVVYLTDYERRNLTQHLKEAGHWPDLFGVVQHPEWQRSSFEFDPAGTLYASDIRIAVKAAVDMGVEGLAPLAAIAVRTRKTMSFAFSILSGEALAGLVVIDQGFTPLILNHIFETRTGADKAEACVAVGLALSALGHVGDAKTLAYSAFSSLSSGVPSVRESELLAEAGIILAMNGDLASAKAVLEELKQVLDIEACPWTDKSWTWASILFLDLMSRLDTSGSAKRPLALLLEHLESTEMPTLLLYDDSSRYWRDRSRICLALYHMGSETHAREQLGVVGSKLLKARIPYAELDEIRCLLQALIASTILDERQIAQEIESRLLRCGHSYISSRLNSEADKLQSVSLVIQALLLTGDESARQKFLLQTSHLPMKVLTQSRFQSIPSISGKLAILKQVVASQFGDWRRYFHKMFTEGAALPTSDLDPRRIEASSVLSSTGEYRVLSLIKLGKWLALSRCTVEAHDLFWRVLAELEQSDLERHPMMLDPSLVGYKTEMYAEILKAMIDMGDRLLTDMAILLSFPRKLFENTEDHNELRHLIESLDGNSVGRGGFRRRGDASRGRIVVHGRLVLRELINKRAVSRIINIFESDPANAVFRYCRSSLLEQLSQTFAPRDLLGLAHKLAGALNFVHVRYAVKWLAIPSIISAAISVGMMLLLHAWTTGSLVIDHSETIQEEALVRQCILALQWISLTYSALVLVTYAVVRRRGPDTDGLTLYARLFGGDYLEAMVKGICSMESPEHLCLAYRIASKIVCQDLRKARAMLHIAVSAARNRNEPLVRVSTSYLEAILTRTRLRERDKRDLIIQFGAAIQNSDLCVYYRNTDVLVSLERLANSFRDEVIRSQAMAVISGALAKCGYNQLAESILRDLIVIIENDKKTGSQIVEALTQSADPDTLLRLREHLVGEAAEQALTGITRLLAAASRIETLESLMPYLQTELKTETFLHALKQCVDGCMAQGRYSAAREWFVQYLAFLPNDLALEALPEVAGVGRGLEMEEAVLSKLQAQLDALRVKEYQSRADGILFLPSATQPLGWVAESLAILKLPKANQLALDVMQHMLSLALDEPEQDTRWAALLYAMPALARVGGQQALIELWNSVRPISLPYPDGLDPD